MPINENFSNGDVYLVLSIGFFFQIVNKTQTCKTIQDIYS